MVLTAAEHLAADVGQLYESPAFSDFIVEASDGKQFHVHRNILTARSKVFRAMLTTQNSKDVLTGRCVVTDVDGPTMDVLLKYMYGTYNTDSPEHCAKTLLVLYAAVKYDLSGLVELCAESLETKLTTSNATDVLLAADQLDLSYLKQSALKMIAEDRREFLRSGQLERVRSQSAELVEEILKGVANCNEGYVYRPRSPAGTSSRFGGGRFSGRLS